MVPLGSLIFSKVSLFQVLLLVGKSPLPADLFKMIGTVKSSIIQKGICKRVIEQSDPTKKHLTDVAL